MINKFSKGINFSKLISSVSSVGPYQYKQRVETIVQSTGIHKMGLFSSPLIPNTWSSFLQDGRTLLNLFCVK